MIQKQFTKLHFYKSKTSQRFTITIPKETIMALGWSKDDWLRLESRKIKRDDPLHDQIEENAILVGRVKN